MNNLKIFTNSDFGQIRAVEIDGEPWLVGKDVARALGYGEGKSLANAVANHVDEEDKGVTELMTPGGKQKMTIINESGVYSLIFSSKLPSAKQFKRWVTSEVLPSLRKTGAYVMPGAAAVITKPLPEVSLPGLAKVANAARRAVLDMGGTRWDAGKEVLSILDYCGLPVPEFAKRDKPAVFLNLVDFW